MRDGEEGEGCLRSQFSRVQQNLRRRRAELVGGRDDRSETRENGEKKTTHGSSMLHTTNTTNTKVGRRFWEYSPQGFKPTFFCWVI